MRFDRRLRALAHVEAWGAASPSAWWAALAARLGLARLAGFFMSDRFWISVALADLQRHCLARDDQGTFVIEDADGRIQAFNEGMRQAYLHLARNMRVTQAEIVAASQSLDEAEREGRYDAVA